MNGTNGSRPGNHLADRSVVSNDSINPYATPKIHDSLSNELSDWQRPFLPQTIAFWTLVVCVCALPSLVMGLLVSGLKGLPPMLFGLVIFSGLYSAADLATRGKLFRKEPKFLIFMEGLGFTRGLMLLFFPVAFFVDGISGAISVISVTALFSTTPSEPASNALKSLEFSLVLLVTLVQGVLLSIQLVVIGVGVVLLRTILRWIGYGARYLNDPARFKQE